MTIKPLSLNIMQQSTVEVIESLIKKTRHEKAMLK